MHVINNSDVYDFFFQTNRFAIKLSTEIKDDSSRKKRKVEY